MNYYRHFPGDYLRDTMHLSAAEDGMYRRLLDIAYTTEKPLPSDRRLIYRLTRCRNASDKRATDRVIDQFFTKGRWGYTHKRVNEEIKRSESRIKAAKENGSQGGRPRKEEKPDGLSEPNLEKSSPESRLHIPDKTLKSSAIDDLKQSILAKSHDPEGMVAAMLEIVCERAERSGTVIHSEAYLLKALENFDTQAGHDREELLQRMRVSVH